MVATPGDRPEAPSDRTQGMIEFRAGLAERGIDLRMHLPASSTTPIVGRNGAGKSSLFSIMTGALPADFGYLRVEGRPIFDLDHGLWPPIHSRGIVHLAQNPLLFPHLNVLDNVAFGLRSGREPAQQARKVALDMLERLGVSHCSRRRPHEVSGGQAARIALARALVVDPQVLLLDEPLAALDVDVRAETREVLAEVLKGRNSFIITHDVDDVTALASTLVLIDQGQAAYISPVGAVNPDEAASGRDFLRSFCATDRLGILCSESP